MNIKFKNKTHLFAALFVGILLLLSLALSGTYALWTITEEQTGSNKIVGGCLNFEMKDSSEAITLENVFPIDDFSGTRLQGYSFTVTNKCSKPMDYRIELDSLYEEDAEFMNNLYIATLLDYGVKSKLSELELLENTDLNVREKHTLAYDTVLGNATNSHVLRIWVDESAPNDEQNKTFLSKVNIVGGQEIEKYYTPTECFAFNYSMDMIINYYPDCGGTDVVIPYQFYDKNNDRVINEFQIAIASFENKGLTSLEIPRSVTEIQPNSINKNPNLTKIVFKDGLSKIGSQAFENTETKGNLSFVMFPKTLTKIDSYAFENNSLEHVIIPDNILNLETYAFQNNNLKDVMVGKGLTVLQNYSFAYNKLENVILPDDGNLTTIGQRAFMNNNIKRLVLPYSVTKINAYAFSNNPGMNLIIKRPDSTGMTLETFWNTSVKVTYDPNAI